jgi:hypothetical protein
MSDNYEKFNSGSNNQKKDDDSSKKQQSDIDKVREQTQDKVRDTLNKK